MSQTWMNTLRGRLALKAFLLTLAATGVVGAATWMVTNRVMNEGLEASATGYLVTIVDELGVAANPLAPNVAALVSHPPDGTVVQIVDMRGGDVLIASSGLQETPLAPIPRGSALQPEGRRVPNPSRPGALLTQSALVSHPTGRLGVIVGVATHDSDRLGRVIGLGVGVAVPVLSLAVAISVWYSVRSALRPVEQLAAEADRTAGAHRSWHLPSIGSPQELRHLTDRLNSLLRRIRTAQDHERIFLEDASHELRTPIAVARAELDLAQSSSADPHARDSLRSAIEELDRLDKLAADLLTLAKVRSRDGPDRQEVSLSGIVRHRVSRLMRDPRQGRVRVTVDGEARAAVDPGSIERAIDNLLTNAIRHSRSEVRAAIATAGREVRILIQDDGPGFPREMLDRGTDRFARDPSRSDGTGLGLAITQAIITAHGGTLRLANAPQGGAVATVTLPKRTGSDPVDTDRSTNPHSHSRGG